MSVFQIEQAHFPSVFVVHFHDLGHGLTDFVKKSIVLHDPGNTVITDEVTVAESQHFDLRVCGQLMENVLERAASEIDPVAVKHVEAERTALGLIPVGSKEVEKLLDEQELKSQL